MSSSETGRRGAAPDPSPAPVPANAAPVIVSSNLTVGYKLHRERKRLTALRDISQALAGEAVGLRDTADGDWTVCYGPVHLGIIKHRANRLQKPKRPARGFVDNPVGLPTTPPAQPQQPHKTQP